jgi:hypothetical protein
MWLTLLVYIWEPLVSDMGQKTMYADQSVHVFPQSLQFNPLLCSVWLDLCKGHNTEHSFLHNGVRRALYDG